MADVSRLVLQVDASVELARRNISALAAAVDGDTKKMDASLRRVDEAHARLGKSSGASRIAQMEFLHVVTASTDALNAGMPVSRVFAMEIGRIAEAAQFAAGAGGLGGFAKYLTGGWGIALQLGISALAMLAGGHHGAGEAAGAHKTAEEKLADAVKAVSEATKNLNDNELVTIQRHLDAARAAEAQAQSLIKVAQAKLASAKADLAADAARANDPTQAQEGGLNINFDIAARRSREVQAITAEIARLDAMSTSAQRSAAEVEARFGRILGEARSSPERSIDFQYNQRQILLDQEFRRRTAGRDATSVDLEWMARQEQALADARERAMRAAQGAAGAEHQLADSQTSLAYMVSFLKREIPGVRITSTNTGTHVRNSDHYADRAIDFVPPGGMQSMTKADIRQMFESNGMRIRRNAAGVEQLFGPGDPGHSNHFHVAWEGSAPTGSTLDRRAATLADTKRRDQETFAGAHAAADQRLAAAQEEAAKNAEDSLDFQIARIGKEREALDEATKRTATEHHWSQAETNVVLELNRRWAAQKVATATARDDAANARDQLQIGEAGLRTETEIARAREQLATTTKERRDSAIALLDLAQQQERLELEAVLASKEANAAQKKIAQDRLAALPQLRSLAVQTIDRQYQRPGQRFLSDINSRDINEQLDEVKIHGLQTLEDELAGVVSGTESVSSAFKRMAQSIIADLARIAIEKEIVIPLANMLFGGSGGGGGGDLLAALGSSTGSLPGFASGGNPPVGRPYIVGERGPEVRIDRTPSTIIPNHLLGRGGRGSAPPPQVIVVQVDKSPYFDVSVDQRIGAAVPAISAHAGKQVIRAITRAGING